MFMLFNRRFWGTSRRYIPTFNNDDEYDDDYFNELYEKVDWVLTLVFKVFFAFT